MCSRREAKRAHDAQDAAAVALSIACQQQLCSDDLTAALRAVYDTTLKETVPDDLKQLVERLQ